MKMTFSAVGDALCPRGVDRGYEGFESVAKEIMAGQVRLANLETVISNFDCFPSTFSGGTWVNAQPAVLGDLKQYGFNMLGCANNHSLDYSFNGLLSTIHHLRQENLAFAGIGKNLHDASAPAVLSLGNGRVAMLSITSSFDDSARAGAQGPALPARPGLNGLRVNTVYNITPEHMKVLREIAAATKMNGQLDNSRKTGFLSPAESGSDIFTFGGLQFREAQEEAKITTCNERDLQRTLDTIQDALDYTDYVVVLAHAHQIRGTEYTQPDLFFEQFCRACIDAGACAVIGSGTHQLQPVEIYNGKPIFYSLGNFIFQSSAVKELPPDFMEKYGLPNDATAATGLRTRSKGGKVGLSTNQDNYRSVIPFFTFEDDTLTQLILTPIELGFTLPDTLKGLPRRATGAEATAIFEILRSLSCDYGTKMHLKNDQIVIEL